MTHLTQHQQQLPHSAWSELTFAQFSSAHHSSAQLTTAQLSLSSAQPTESSSIAQCLTACGLQVRTMEMQAGLAMSRPINFGQRAALAGTRVGQKLSHLTTRRVIIGKTSHKLLLAITIACVAKVAVLAGVRLESQMLQFSTRHIISKMPTVYQAYQKCCALAAGHWGRCVSSMSRSQHADNQLLYRHTTKHNKNTKGPAATLCTACPTFLHWSWNASSVWSF